ncbi:hypothetical protein DC498_10890 [Terrimonas sp.]|uniref:hypothetical protein n=1 Tax=Terrimonas sp. TaxID=1914338 RepID=UPI000D511FC7|nr:hypothetical protein [Terrimonas sp.]PVD52221.1 hypothetical protein DC498_10890 [Terrimonas sp.]
MENISVLTDFPESEFQQYYKKIAENILGDYTIYSGGNYIYISNNKNRTIRFTSQNFDLKNFQAEQLLYWLEVIRKKYPSF